MKKAMLLSGTISLALIAMGTVFKIFHWPGAAFALLIGFAILCLLFFPSAIYLNHKSEQNRPMLNLSILLGGITFMTGILFKVMHWPGAAFLLFAGWSVILGIFLPILLFSKLKETTVSKERSIYILGAIALIVFEAATMFKFFHWPGAGPLMIVGSIMLIGVFIPMFTNLKLKNKEMNTGQFIFVITLSMYAIVFTVMLAMNVSGPVLERFVRDDSNSAKILSYFEKKEARLISEGKLRADSSEALLAELKLAVMESADRVEKIISAIKLELIEKVDGADKNSALALNNNPGLIKAKDNYDKVNLLLLSAGNTTLKTLKEELEKFKKYTCDIGSRKPGLNTQIENLLDTSDKEQDGKTRSWEERNFRNNLLIGAIAQLSEIQKNVRMIESETLSSIK